MPDETPPAIDATIRLSERAAGRIRELVAAENNPGLMFRVSVSGGGCSGFQYGFSLDDVRHADDRVVTRDGATLVVDETSLDLLRGAEVDYVEDLVGSYFAVKNPNASATCGCGSSFAL